MNNNYSSQELVPVPLMTMALCINCFKFNILGMWSNELRADNLLSQHIYMLITPYNIE